MLQNIVYNPLLSGCIMTAQITPGLMKSALFIHIFAQIFTSTEPSPFSIETSDPKVGLHLNDFILSSAPLFDYHLPIPFYPNFQKYPPKPGCRWIQLLKNFYIALDEQIEEFKVHRFYEGIQSNFEQINPAVLNCIAATFPTINENTLFIYI